VIGMAEVRLTMEEYQALLRLQGSERESEGTRLSNRTRSKPKRKGTPLKGMKAALTKANAMARKKDGSFKKGWTQAKVMSKAHKIRRRG